ncbi:MAG: RNase adapter RapZ [Ilumatobacteraceae bacterium]
MAETIERERELLDPVSRRPGGRHDRSERPHQLKALVQETFGDEHHRATMQVAVTSFGYKQGIPLDVDLVIDVRFLPNPHWVEDLRPLTGADARCATTCSVSRPRPSSCSASSTCSSCCCLHTSTRARATCRSPSGAPADVTGRSPSPKSSPPGCARRATDLGSTADHQLIRDISIVHENGTLFPAGNARSHAPRLGTVRSVLQRPPRLVRESTDPHLKGRPS